MRRFLPDLRIVVHLFLVDVQDMFGVAVAVSPSLCGVGFLRAAPAPLRVWAGLHALPVFGQIAAHVFQGLAHFLDADLRDGRRRRPAQAQLRIAAQAGGQAEQGFVRVGLDAAALRRERPVPIRLEPSASRQNNRRVLAVDEHNAQAQASQRRAHAATGMLDDLASIGHRARIAARFRVRARRGFGACGGKTGRRNRRQHARTDIGYPG
ncbi:MAG: hypothetical protein MO853_03230 [Candidatus Protistobacter heckmanni]|nr:hypothetical protein [Candidatus Protistobacter heckmanni]